MIKLDELQTVARINSLGTAEYVQLGGSVIAELPIAIVECLLRGGIRKDGGVYFLEGFLQGFILALICASDSLTPATPATPDASANPEKAPPFLTIVGSEPLTFVEQTHLRVEPWTPDSERIVSDASANPES